MAARRLAVPRASAYAHVVKATDVGKTPRYISHARSTGEAAWRSRTKPGAYNRQDRAPIAQQVHVTCRAESRASTGFCATTPAADEAVAMTHSTTPHKGALPDIVASAMTITPANATAPPTNNPAVRRSRRNTAAKAMIKRGAMLMTIAAVPASTVRSAVLRATLYKPNHNRPAIAKSASSRRAGRVRPRRSSGMPSRILPIRRRPSAREPGEMVRVAARIPTNADDQRQTDTSAATSGRQFRARTLG